MEVATLVIAILALTASIASIAIQVTLLLVSRSQPTPSKELVIENTEEERAALENFLTVQKGETPEDAAKKFDESFAHPDGPYTGIDQEFDL